MMSEKKLNLELDVTELNNEQIRLIKSISTMLTHIMSTEHEDEYFDHSSELMTLVANAVKKANFSADFEQTSKIEYGRQALEFCVDHLADQIYQDNVARYDN